MSKSLFVVLGLGLVGCGGEATSPLVAAFPMGPRQVRLAVFERYGSVMAPTDVQWPASQPAVQADLTVVRSAVVEVAGPATFSARPLKVDPAVVSVDLDDQPVDEVELLLGPGDAASLDDPRVRSVAHGPVPRLRRENARLTWTADGAQVLAAALDGKLEGQGGKRQITLFLKGRALVRLDPGLPLPVNEAEAKITLHIPMRYAP